MRYTKWACLMTLLVTAGCTGKIETLLEGQIRKQKGYHDDQQSKLDTLTTKVGEVSNRVTTLEGTIKTEGNTTREEIKTTAAREAERIIELYGKGPALPVPDDDDPVGPPAAGHVPQQMGMQEMVDNGVGLLESLGRGRDALNKLGLDVVPLERNATLERLDRLEGSFEDLKEEIRKGVKEIKDHGDVNRMDVESALKLMVDLAKEKEEMSLAETREIFKAGVDSLKEEIRKNRGGRWNVETNIEIIFNQPPRHVTVERHYSAKHYTIWPGRRVYYYPHLYTRDGYRRWYYYVWCG